MPHVRIVHDDPGTIRLAHPHSAGLIGVLFGGAMAYGVHRFVGPGSERAWAIGVGILFALSAVSPLSWHSRRF